MKLIDDGDLKNVRFNYSLSYIYLGQGVWRFYLFETKEREPENLGQLGC
jgi:hypothetical protein